MKPRVAAVVAAALAIGFGAAGASAAGIAPGFSQNGIVSTSGVRYDTVQQGQTTIVQSIRTGDARLLGTIRLNGAYGVPAVTIDGVAGGLSRDGKRLVVETAPYRTWTRFAVLDTTAMKLEQSFRLRGTWSYDALSPDGNTLYLIQVVRTTHYLVRAYDLTLRKLVPGAIADKREPGPMVGWPLSRVASADGVWSFTLYLRPGSHPFIHALNTRDRVARCLDLSWPGLSDMSGVSLGLSADGRQLVVRDAVGKTVDALAAPH
ncbi:MAG TPA: hypothetical protein VLJ76_08655 [Gaiellaceae bacterium]|nr:hypothetical protein [Gaiellaceae bacterium]